MGLIERLLPGPVGLDTSVFIYFLEGEPAFQPLLLPLFQALDQQAIQAATSELTLLEVLVQPFRHGRLDLARRYESLLRFGPGLTLLPIDAQCLKVAAHLRATAGVKTPDAIHLAGSLSHGCTVFLTNDRRLSGVAEMDVLQLRDFLPQDLVMEPPTPEYGGP